MPHSSLAIANEFLRRAREIDRSLTQMKLQKLVYIAHGWCLAFSKSPLIEDRIEAWEFGPVIRRLYDATSRYGRSPVSRFIKWGDDTPFSRHSPDAIQIRGNRTTVPPPRELYPFRSHPMA